MIDMSKKYRTRDGREVRLLCVDGPGAHPVIGIVTDRIGVQSLNGLTVWNPSGLYFSGTTQGIDLIEVVPDVVRWINVYSDDTEARGHKSLSNANLCAARNITAILKTTIRNGGQSHADVTVEVLPVDYKETP